MSPRPWQRIGREPLRDCRVFRVERVLARSPSTGAEHDFFCIDSPSWVNVIAVTQDERIVLVRQYRHGSQSMTLEIPGGLVDPGETPADAALRELREETGFAAPRAIAVGDVNPNPALFGNRLHTFLAPGAQRVGEVMNHGTEETAVELVAIEAIPELVRSGAIDHALVLAGLYQWEILRRSGGMP